jgi:hypothetical protein
VCDQRFCWRPPAAGRLRGLGQEKVSVKSKSSFIYIASSLQTAACVRISLPETNRRNTGQIFSISLAAELAQKIRTVLILRQSHISIEARLFAQLFANGPKVTQVMQTLRYVDSGVYLKFHVCCKKN